MAKRMTTSPGGKPPGKPSFFWQGLLILLPVVALASVGLYALRQDKALARLAATEHAQALGDLIADTFWNTLAVLPGSGASNPHSFQIDRAGHLVFPRPYAKTPVPQAFPWTSLSPEQNRFWLVAIGSESAEKSDRAAINETWKKFLSLSPPVEFAASARFHLGLGLAKQEPVAAAMEQFRIVIEQHPLAIGESGLPLRPLAQMKLLELAVTDPTRSGSETMALLNSVCSNAVTYPTAVTPHLLKLAQEREAALDSTPSIWRRWMEVWIRHESARTLYAAAAPHLAPLDAMTEAAPDWADVNGLHSSPLRLSRAVLLDRARIKLPDYFDISLDVAGKTVLSSNQLPVLVYTTGGKGSGQYWKRTASAAPPSLLAQARKVEEGVEQLRVGIHLIGPELLYARERDRALWFGALIAASALAAFLGFASAWRAFARQQRLGEMKSNFVSSVSHELRAPIASVRLMAEGLQRGTLKEPTRQQEYFRFIVQECRRLSALIENVLDFSRIEQGRKQYEFEPTDLTTLVRETARLL